MKRWRALFAHRKPASTRLPFRSDEVNSAIAELGAFEVVRGLCAFPYPDGRWRLIDYDELFVLGLLVHRARRAQPRNIDACHRPAFRLHAWRKKRTSTACMPERWTPQTQYVLRIHGRRGDEMPIAFACLDDAYDAWSEAAARGRHADILGPDLSRGVWCLLVTTESARAA